MSKKPLDGRTALVTGGGGPAMGSAHCRALSGLGAHIIVQDLRAAEAHKVVSDIKSNGGSAEVLEGDITKLSVILPRIRSILEARNIDILVNHAGISGLSMSFEDIDETFFDKMMSVHVKSTFFVTQSVVSRMKEQSWGRIINVASDFAMYGSPTASHYTASKSALLGLTKSWARELAEWKICVNAVAPTLLKSELTIQSKGEAFLEAESQLAPMGALPEPDDVAAVVGFLASPAAQAITGQTISPNGGRTIVGI